MSHYRDHLGLGYAGRPLHLAQYLPLDERASDRAGRSGVTTHHHDSTRQLDEIGHEVQVRQVPDFWKPCEEWTLD